MRQIVGVNYHEKESSLTTIIILFAERIMFEVKRDNQISHAIVTRHGSTYEHFY